MKKLVKLGRYLAARCGPPDAARFFWHIGTPNFGDDINRELFALLGGRPVRLRTDRSQPHFLGMGSILEKATDQSVVLGSGFLRKPVGPVGKEAKYVAVRGKLSRDALGVGEEVLLGDPMVLLGQVFRPTSERKHTLGVVPHVTEVAALRKHAPPGLRVIDPADSPWEVIKEIGACERIMSQSLHGLIVADALGIPNLWLAPSVSMAGGEFKFLDYFSTLDAAKRPYAPTAELLAAPPQDFTVGRYLFDKVAYHEAMRKALQA